MHFTSALLLPALALAAPIAETESTRPSPGPFTLMSVRSASPIHYATINAAGQAFWIGKNTSTYCPEGVSGLDCSKFNSNTTVLSTSEANVATSAFLSTTVPGGQSLYVQKNGALGYTQAHSASIPSGASTTGFIWTPPQTSQYPYGHFSYKGGLVACPAKDAGVYQIFANVKGLKNADKCLGFDAFALPYSGANAWQYT